VREFLLPLPLVAFIAQTGSASDWPTLVKEFGTWVIWLLIAAYIFKRSEKRDDQANKERLDVQKELLQLQKDNSEELKRLLLICTSAIQSSNRYKKAIAQAFTGSKCLHFIPPAPKKQDGEEEEQDES
jgi:hypothetical protein